MEALTARHRPLFARVRCLVTDVDGTMTGVGASGGDGASGSDNDARAGDPDKLGAEAYSALWKLRAAGIKVIAATGRSAAWAGMMLRQWPVDAVVAENGAIGYWLEGGRQRTAIHPALAGEGGRGLLDRLRAGIPARFPGAREASDQHGRLHDLAIDYAEDEPRMGREWAEELARYARAEGAVASVSSTHINIAGARFDKSELASEILSSFLGVPPMDFGCAVAAIGDGANDQGLFERFPLSAGVANIAEGLPYMARLPAFVVSAPRGEGFAEFAAFLIGAVKALREKK